MTSVERELLTMTADYSEEEMQELLRFIEALNNGLEVTSEEAYEMGREARKRLGK